VGAARFLRGLTRVIEPRDVVVIGNTADDDEFFGLHVSPDLDTLTYTLAGVSPRTQGWGLAGDRFSALAALARFYAETWFQLGDRDLATHIYRTDRLRRGQPLETITRSLAQCFGVEARLLPMTNDRVRTVVHTAKGPLPFQAYLVRDRGRAAVERIELRGIRRARPLPAALRALDRAAMVIIPPSNPLVSIGPILSLPGFRRHLRRIRAPVAAVSPIIGGRPVKGPADRMLRGLGLEVSPVGVATLYRDIVDLFVLDRRDAALAPRVRALGCEVLVADTLIARPARAAQLARRIVNALSVLRRPPGRGRTGETRRSRSHGHGDSHPRAAARPAGGRSAGTAARRHRGRRGAPRGG
jgi:LPPG:FO 2-phospho-L-lactate transferase